MSDLVVIKAKVRELTGNFNVSTDFVEALDEANCRMSFLGMESLNEESLRGVQKKQNKVQEYKEYFDKLNRKGILTFTGLMFALEEDTNEYYDKLYEKLKIKYQNCGINNIQYTSIP